MRAYDMVGEEERREKEEKGEAGRTQADEGLGLFSHSQVRESAQHGKGVARYSKGTTAR